MHQVNSQPLARQLLLVFVTGSIGTSRPSSVTVQLNEHVE